MGEGRQRTRADTSRALRRTYSLEPGLAEGAGRGPGVSCMRESIRRQSGWMGHRRVLGALVVALGVLAARGASALTIDDTNPLFFLGGGLFGFSEAAVEAAGLSVVDHATPADSFLSAGNAIYGPQLSITQSLGPIYQNPQAAYQNPAAGCHDGDVCQTPENPFIADSTWTVTNNTGRDLAWVMLVFTRVSLADGYPDIPVALDGNRIFILEYTAAAQTYYFAMVSLGPLGNGDGSDGEHAQSTQFVMRYIVGGDMPFSGNVQVMPPIGVYGLERAGGPIPEPATAVLLASGLMALAMAKRSRA